MNEALAAKHEAMDRVEANASEEWKAAMWSVVEEVAQNSKLFTSDEVFALADMKGIERPHEPRALGPIMRRAAMEGICRKANLPPVNSQRSSRHAAPLSVWESLIYEQENE